MKKQDAMQEIETIRARLTVLEKIVQEEEKPQGLWRPEHGDKYWYVDDYMGISGYVVDGKVSDYRRATGNCFPTRQAAEKAAPLFARAHKIIQAASMADPDAGIYEHGLREYTATKCFFGGWQYARSSANDGQATAAIVHVSTREQAEHMAAILNAEGV